MCAGQQHLRTEKANIEAQATTFVLPDSGGHRNLMVEFTQLRILNGGCSCNTDQFEIGSMATGYPTIWRNARTWTCSNPSGRLVSVSIPCLRTRHNRRRSTHRWPQGRPNRYCRRDLRICAGRRRTVVRGGGSSEHVGWHCGKCTHFSASCPDKGGRPCSITTLLAGHDLIEDDTRHPVFEGSNSPLRLDCTGWRLLIFCEAR